MAFSGGTMMGELIEPPILRMYRLTLIGMNGTSDSIAMTSDAQTLQLTLRIASPVAQWFTCCSMVVAPSAGCNNSPCISICTSPRLIPRTIGDPQRSAAGCSYHVVGMNQGTLLRICCMTHLQPNKLTNLYHPMSSRTDCS